MARLAEHESVYDRRRLLARALQGVAAGLVVATIPGTDLLGARRWRANPFTLGVASGDPSPHGAVLWTRRRRAG